MQTSPDNHRESQTEEVHSAERFHTEEEIIQQIDKCHKRSRSFIESAELLERKALEVLRRGGATCEETFKANEDLKLAHARRVRAMNLINKKAKLLSKSLATFRTGILFPMDQSIPVPKNK